jgi:hypothetical protein
VLLFVSFFVSLTLVYVSSHPKPTGPCKAGTQTKTGSCKTGTQTKTSSGETGTQTKTSSCCSKAGT